MDLRRIIEHTQLRPDATAADIQTVVEEAVEHRFFGVCVASSWVPIVKEKLSGLDATNLVRIVSVVGFPHGNSTTESKIVEAETAIRNGASEIDMVMHIGWMKSGRVEYTLDDMKRVVMACKSLGAEAVKIILETGYLTVDEIRVACKLALAADAQFVKTSTGFGPRGASVDDILIMRSEVGTKIGIKASGGIRTYEEALCLIKAGATRLGASGSIKLVEDQRFGVATQGLRSSSNSYKLRRRTKTL